MDENARPVTSDLEAGKSPDEIRRDILRTQAEMDRTITALEDRLSPRNIYERSTGAARQKIERASQQASEAASRAAVHARQRVEALGPGRAAGGAVAGLVTLWMMARSVRQRRKVRDDEQTMDRAIFMDSPEMLAHDAPRPARRRSHRNGWLAAAALVGGVAAAVATVARRCREEEAFLPPSQLPLEDEVAVPYPPSSDEFGPRPVA